MKIENNNEIMDIHGYWFLIGSFVEQWIRKFPDF